MTDQPTITEEAVDAYDAAADEVETAIANSVSAETMDARREGIRAGLVAATPWIAAQALRRAATIVERSGRDATSSDPSSRRAVEAFAAAACTALRIAANTEEIGARPGPAAPTTEPDDDRHHDCPLGHCGSWALHNPHGECPGTRD